jgi:TP901 family phage tail tape measure protein
MVDIARLEIQADSRSVKTASKNLGEFDKSAGLAGAALSRLAPLVTAFFSGKALIGLANQAMAFNTAMAEVNTLLADSNELVKLNEEAKALAATFGGSPTAQAQAFYQAISAGAGNAEEATALLTAANKLAIGGVTDVTTAVDGLTSITNAYGIETSKASTVSDAFFVAMRAGKTTVGELSG